MNPTRTIQSLAFLALAGFCQAANAQESISVHLEPDSESTLIGKLDSRSLAVNAGWPKNRRPIPGWQPIHYRGKFLVYLDSYDLGKNHAPVPGSRYLLSPSPNAPVLAIATDEDKADIIEIDPRYCHINLETIVLGYIEDNAARPPALPIRSALGKTPAKPFVADTAIKTIEGILVATNSFESERTGYGFKLIDNDNKILAFVDPSRLAEHLVFTDYINAKLIASGSLKEGSSEGELILSVQNLKKKN